jgi:hypothetical protein
MSTKSCVDQTLSRPVGFLPNDVEPTQRAFVVADTIYLPVDNIKSHNIDLQLNQGPMI